LEAQCANLKKHAVFKNPSNPSIFIGHVNVKTYSYFEVYKHYYFTFLCIYTEQTSRLKKVKYAPEFMHIVTYVTQ
jgi:hypothetical protein